VHCIRRTDGSLMWQQSVGSPVGATHSRNRHASATPAVDAQRVFVAFGGLGLFCFNHEGEQLWRVPLPSAEHEWGSASSPVLYRNLVIQLCDGRRDSFLAAYEKSSGDEVWRAPRQSTGCWSTPVLVVAGEGDSSREELIVNGTGGSNSSRGKVIAYDPQTGAELWHVRGTTDIPCPTIIAGDGLVFSTSGGNGPVLAIKPGGEGDVTRTHVAWRRAAGGPYVPTGVACDGRLYTIADSGTFRCYNAADGAEIWKRRLRGTFSASLIAAEGRIYAFSEQGFVHVLAAGDEYRPLAMNQMHEPCFATPAIVDGEILLRTERSLFCIAAKPQMLAQDAKDAGVTTIASGAKASPSDAAASAELPVAAKRATHSATDDVRNTSPPVQRGDPNRKPARKSPSATTAPL
jgi:outer membrane protein assembly factor BamB